MPKRNTRNIKYKFLQKFLLCFQRIKHNFYWKIELLKQATYIWYVIAKILKFVQNNMLISTEFFLQRIFWK